MILVSGGSGFIGSHLLDRLAASGIPARAIVRRKTALPSGIEPAFADLVSGEGVAEAVRGAGTIIHLAGVTKALRPDDYYAGNLRATENLVRAAEAGTRFVHVSSLAATGPSPDGVPITEADQPHPITHYGRSKLEAELAVRRYTPDAVIVRPPVVYGPRDTGVFQILKSVARGLVVQIAGGERWFSQIFAADLVDGLLAAATHPAAPGHTYFIAHPKPATWTELGNAAACIMQRRARTLTVPVPIAFAAGFASEVWARLTGKASIVSREKIVEARPHYWVCDTQSATRDLGFEARTSLEAGLAVTLAWYKEAGWLSY
jgi:nucleoside-diphosphate-sugar epimerase